MTIDSNRAIEKSLGPDQDGEASFKTRPGFWNQGRLDKYSLKPEPQRNINQNQTITETGHFKTRQGRRSITLKPDQGGEVLF